MSKTLPPAPAPLDETPAMEQFVDKHFKSLIIVVAVVVLGLLGYAIVRLNGQKKAEEAGAAFVSAKTVADCDLVIQKYSGTEAAGNALLLKADLLWEENKKDSSVAALKEFVSKHTNHPFFPQALAALGSKLESVGERGEAKPIFERVMTEFPDAEVAPLAQIRVGDILWAEGKEEEAKKAYESVPAKFSNADSSFINESEDRLKWIAAKLPTKEVDGPPKPKETPPAPGAPSVPGLPQIPGMPQMKLNSGTGLSPTIAPDAAGNTPAIQIKPGPPATPPAGSPGVTMPVPTLTPPPGPVPTSVPAPATPPPVVPKPTPAPAASTPAPAVPAPVAPATTSPPAPVAAPAATTPAPIPAAVPAPTTAVPATSEQAPKAP